MGAPLGNVVLLAGGASSRMGAPKGLVAVDGRRWIEHQLDRAERFALDRPIVVLGFDHARYTREVDGLHARARVVVNPAPERGPFSSLQRGLSCAAPEQPTFVLPVDVPAPGDDVWTSLRASMDPALEAAVPVHRGRGGHPVVLSAALVARLLRLPPDTRLDHELSRCAVARVTVADPLVLQNLNSPEDWRALERDLCR